MRGRAEAPRLAARERDDRELARGVVLEEQVVVRALEQVLVGAQRRHFAVRFLHQRPFGRGGFVRRLAADARDQREQQARAARQPLEALAEDRVEPARELAQLCSAAALPHPQLAALAAHQRERESLSAVRPAHRGDASSAGQLDRPPRQRRALDQHERAPEAELALCIRGRVDAQARQAHEGLRHFRQRGHRRVHDLEPGARVRRQEEPGRAGRVEQLDERARRHLVTQRFGVHRGVRARSTMPR